MELNSTEEVIADIRAGKMVIIMDDEDRENEGDLIMAASCARSEDVNFMARFGRGLICLTLTRERCTQLRLPLMVTRNEAMQATNFTLSIEAAEGVTTGISAADRARTIAAAVEPDARPEDLVQPGHVFPLMAQPGGVLSRAGHTEAGCDLARLAGFEPAAVIVEILNDDGTMARRPDLEQFAREHDLKLGTVADLIHYRIANEKSVERLAECSLPTEYGTFHLVSYQDSVDGDIHMALVKGVIRADQPTLVRVHLQNDLCDLFSPLKEDCGWPLRSALERLSREESGVLVVLRDRDYQQGLIRRIRDYQLEDRGVDLQRTPPPSDLRTYGIGAQILADLGVRKMRVLSAPKKIHALPGFDLEVVEYVNCE